MNREKEYDRWVGHALNWRERAAEVGLDGLLSALAQVMRPLGPLAAQVLWVAQPTLGMFSGELSEDANALANLLDDPATLDRLLNEMTSPDVEGVR